MGSPNELHYELRTFGRKRVEHVVYRCPGCGEELKSPLADAAKRDRCSLCSVEFTVPGATLRAQREQAAAAKLAEQRAAARRAQEARNARNAEHDNGRPTSPLTSIGTSDDPNVAGESVMARAARLTEDRRAEARQAHEKKELSRRTTSAIKRCEDAGGALRTVANVMTFFAAIPVFVCIGLLSEEQVLLGLLTLTAIVPIAATAALLAGVGALCKAGAAALSER